MQGAMGSCETALCATCKGSKETTHAVGTETELGAIGVGVFLDKRLPVKELASALGGRSPAQANRLPSWQLCLRVTTY